MAPTSALQEEYLMSDDDKTLWVLRFATRLHQLRPSVSGSAAAKIAEDAYDSVRTVAPEKAALVYALKMASIAAATDL